MTPLATAGRRVRARCRHPIDLVERSAGDRKDVAAAYAEQHLLTLLVEIDGLRTSIGGWRDRDETKLLAGELALVMTARHLSSGYDVIVPQYLGRPAFIDALAAIAEAAGASFIELLLVAADDEVLERFLRRRGMGFSDHPAERVGDVGALIADSQAHLREVVSSRPRTILIDATGDITTIAGRNTAAVHSTA